MVCVKRIFCRDVRGVRFGTLVAPHPGYEMERKRWKTLAWTAVADMVVRKRKMIVSAPLFFLGVLAGCAPRYGDSGVRHSFHLHRGGQITQVWSDAKEAFEGAGLHLAPAASPTANAHRIEAFSSVDLGAVAGCEASGRARVALRLRQASTGGTTISISVVGHPPNNFGAAGCLNALKSWTREVGSRIGTS